MVFCNFLLFSVIPAFEQGSYEEISAGTVFLMAIFVFAFPIVSGILVFYIVRGILQGITSRRNLQKKHRIINWTSAVGCGLLVLFVMVLQIRLSV